MTDKSTERRSSSGQGTWIWMLASLLAIGGFMYWLGASAQPSGPQVVEEDVGTDSGIAAATVALDDLVNELTTYVGTDVRLEGISVASRLGSQAFWTTTSKGMPFLIKLAPALVADEVSVEGAASVTVAGRVLMMSDSVLSAWEEEGAIANESHRMEAEFATGFIEAVEVEAVPAAGTDSGAEESAPQQ